MKKSLKDSYVYEIFDLEKAINNIGSVINPSLDKYALTPDQLSVLISDFKSKVTAHNKENVIHAVESGKVIFINAKGVQLPAWAIVTKQGTVAAVVNIASKVRVNNEGTLSYQPREIFGFAVMGTVLAAFYGAEKRFTLNPALTNQMGVVYSRLLMRTMDSIFSVNAMGNERESHLLEFLIIRFFLRNVLELEYGPQKEAEFVLSVMSKSRPQKSAIQVNGMSLMQEGMSFPDEAFQNFDKFCKTLATSLPSLRKLETNTLLRKVITSMGERSALMLESPHYLYALIASSAFKGNVIKDYQIESYVGKDILAQAGIRIVGLSFTG